MAKRDLGRSVAGVMLIMCAAAWGNGSTTPAVPTDSRITITIVADGVRIRPDEASGDLLLPVVTEGFSDDRDVEGTLRDLLEALRSPQYAVREEATRALLRLPPGRLSDVAGALEKETDAEAVARLTEVIAHLYLKPRTSLRGSASMLGISLSLETTRLDPKDEEPILTVAVASVKPGYPAAQSLQVGDRIVAINGRRFPMDMDATGFRAQIAALPPGAATRFTVLRERRLLDLMVQTAGVTTSSLELLIQEREVAAREYLRKLKTADTSTAE